MKELGLHNKYIESSRKTMERLELFKMYINGFLDENNSKLGGDKKVLVVGHSILFKHLTSRKLYEDTYEPFEDEIVLKNCETVSLSFI